MATDDRTPDDAAAFLAALPDERRPTVEAVRGVILDHLPDGMVEEVRWGMLSYEVPLERCPHTHNGQPLGYVALAAQKRYYSVYLMGVYADDARRAEFETAYRATGKRYDVGKSCVRFRTLDDLPLDVVGQAVAAYTTDTWIDAYEAARSGG